MFSTIKLNFNNKYISWPTDLLIRQETLPTIQYSFQDCNRLFSRPFPHRKGVQTDTSCFQFSNFQRSSFLGARKVSVLEARFLLSISRKIFKMFHFDNLKNSNEFILDQSKIGSLYFYFIFLGTRNKFVNTSVSSS